MTTTTETILLNTIQQLVDENSTRDCEYRALERDADKKADQIKRLLDDLAAARTAQLNAEAALAKAQRQLSLLDAEERFDIVVEQEPKDGRNKIPLIKELRTALGIGLVEAKRIVDGDRHDMRLRRSVAAQINLAVAGSGFSVALEKSE